MRQLYLFLLLCLAVYVRAQSPDLINYQGVMRGTSGIPMAGRNIKVHFELRQGSATSGPVYQEDQPVSTNQLGLFSTQVGKINPGVFGSIDWQAGPMFLSVAVDTTGGTNFTEMGVQQLVSVPYAMNARTVEKVASSYSANVLTIAGQSYTLSQPSNSFAAGTGITITGSVIANSAPDQTVTIDPAGSNVQVTGAYPNFSIASTPSLSYNNGQLGISDGNSVNITQTVSVQNNILTVGPPTNTVMLPSGITPSISGQGAAIVNPASGNNFTVNVPPANVSISNSVGAASSSTNGINDININIPAPQFNPATGALTTGTVVNNITPLVTFNSGVLTVGPSTNNVAIPASPATTLNATGAATLNPTGPTYNLHVIPASIAVTTNVAAAGATSLAPNSFSINIPPPQYNAATGILTTGTATTNVTPTLGFSSGVLTVGPSTNNIAIPIAPATTLNATGAATLNPSGPTYNLHVIPASIAITTNVAAAGATSLAPNSFSINIPPPQYNQATGILTTGTATTNVTPTLAFSSGVLTVGPSTNNIAIPIAPATTLNATGAATLNPTGPTYNLHVIPASIAITTNVAAAGATSLAPNNFSINIPPPQYNQATGILTTGTATTNVTPTLAFSSGVLTVGPSTNNIAIPIAPATTLIATGAATLNPTGPGYSLHVIPASIAVTTNVAAAGATSLAPNNFSINIPPPVYNPATGVLTTGTSTQLIAPAVSLTGNMLTVGPATNAIAVPVPTVASQGWAVVSPSTGLNFTVNVPVPSYNATTGVLTSGTVNTSVVPALNFTNNILTVGPSTNFVDLSSLSPWTETGGTVALTTMSNHVGIGTNTPTGMMDVDVQGNNVNAINLRNTRDIVGAAIPLHISETTAGQTFGTNTYGRMLRLTNQTLNSSYDFGIDAAGSFYLAYLNSYSPPAFLINQSGRVGIGTPSPAEMLEVGSYSLAQSNYISVKTAGSNSYKAGLKLNHFNNNDGFTIESDETVNMLNIIRHGTTSNTVMSIDRLADHVGIGTTSPSATLHVAGTFRLEDGSEALNRVLTSDALGNASWKDVALAWTYTGNAGTNAATNFVGTTDNVGLTFRTNNSNRMHITNMGAVGIGTMTPAGKLHVESTNGRFQVLDVASSGGSILLGSYIGNSGLGPQTRFSIDGNTNTADIGLTSSANFVIEMNNTPKISVAQSNGFVGISTATAGTELEVNGDISIPSSGKFIFGTNGSGIGEWMENTSSGLGFFTSSLQRMQIENNGNVGIGTVAPATKLELSASETVTGITINGGSPGTTFRISNTDNTTSNNFSALSFATSASNGGTYESSKIVAVHVNHTVGSAQGDIAFLTRAPGALNETMRITGTRRVGVNTTAPTATFQVNGTTRLVDGTEGQGKILTSDAAGNASWQTNPGAYPGMVTAFAGPTANIPSGWIECDGSALSRTTYSALFSVIGTAWGVGDGSTTFNIPDMRGMFLRGVNSGGSTNDPNAATRTAINGGNSGNNVGSQQDDAFETHTHTISNHGATNSGFGLLGTATGYVPGGTTTSNGTGGSETRPKNVYVYYIIKL